MGRFTSGERRGLIVLVILLAVIVTIVGIDRLNSSDPSASVVATPAGTEIETVEGVAADSAHHRRGRHKKHQHGSRQKSKSVRQRDSDERNYRDEEF